MRVFTQRQIQEIFTELAKELEQDGRNATAPDVSAALYAIAHRIACIDWEWLAKEPENDEAKP